AGGWLVPTDDSVDHIGLAPLLTVFQSDDKGAVSLIAKRGHFRNGNRRSIEQIVEKPDAFARRRTGARGGGYGGRGSSRRPDRRRGRRQIAGMGRRNQALLEFRRRLQAQLRAHGLDRAIDAIEPDAIVIDHAAALDAGYNIIAGVRQRLPRQRSQPNDQNRNDISKLHAMPPPLNSRQREEFDDAEPPNQWPSRCTPDSPGSAEKLFGPLPS